MLFLDLLLIEHNLKSLVLKLLLSVSLDEQAYLQAHPSKRRILLSNTSDLVNPQLPHSREYGDIYHYIFADLIENELLLAD